MLQIYTSRGEINMTPIIILLFIKDINKLSDQQQHA